MTVCHAQPWLQAAPRPPNPYLSTQGLKEVLSLPNGAAKFPASNVQAPPPTTWSSHDLRTMDSQAGPWEEA